MFTRTTSVYAYVFVYANERGAVEAVGGQKIDTKRLPFSSHWVLSEANGSRTFRDKVN